ncbi:MAG TPA: metalloregulator ArsR/SmtB family transcription factor [Thermoanaerobaculia bacterium]|nr:metalloregulator ArsR/SmtB family transcription factor [Thermoanaerobaculia bacterium]
MSPRNALQQSAPIFAALGDETRLRVVSRLSAGGPMSIAQLTEGTDVTRQAVTKHLEVLAGAGLVHDFRQGRERVWELRTRRLEEARRALDLISQRWDEALERLRALVE